MENDEKSLFKKPAGKGEQILAEENLVSPRNHKECLDEREGLKAMGEKSDLLIRAGSSRGLDISKGERVMREKTTLNNPISSSTIGKKKVLPRNTTEEDVKDYISKSHRLAHIGKKARKLYKKEEEEEEPANEDHTSIFPSPLDASDAEIKSSIKKPDLILDDMKGLGFGPHLSPVFELFLVSLRAKGTGRQRRVLISKGRG
ncbi:uncharacterized protein LOC131328728 [Rhododendron vialii]|uniref:uncharacterized protein LOC131328728 n=1 Tax=Rhododendron vialii TaxID=182163 RepID=UPI002660427C|nr:uncharacterized protein LOC131328728 [Rhododendron vialii]